MWRDYKRGFDGAARWEARPRQCRWRTSGLMKASRTSSVRKMFTCDTHKGKEGSRGEEEEAVRPLIKMAEKGNILIVVLTYKMCPLSRERPMFISRQNTEDRPRHKPYSFPKWHKGNLHTHTHTHTRLYHTVGTTDWKQPCGIHPF